MQKIRSFVVGHKKIFIFLLVLLLAILGFMFIKLREGGKAQSIDFSQIVELQKKDLVNAINENGNVVTRDSVDVYSKKQLPVQSVEVKEGDVVHEGDVIATLDASDILKQIETKKAAKSAADKTQNSQIQTAKNRLAEALKLKNSGKNSGIQSAQQAITTARDAWLAAKKTADDYERSLVERYNPELIGEKNARQTAANQEKDSYTKKMDLLQKNSVDNSKLDEYRRLAGEYKAQKDRIQNRIDEMSRYETELGIRQGRLQQELTDAQTPPPQPDMPSDVNSNDGKENKITPPPVFVPDQLRIRDLKNQLENISREQNEIKIEVQKLTEDQSKAASRASEYEGKIDALVTAIEDRQTEIRDADRQIDRAKEEIQSNENTSLKNDKTRRDQLKTYRAQEETAHKAYLASVDNLKTAIAQADNEISQLRDGVKTAQSGSNNLDSIDLKFLKDELEDTVIKAPTSGTITKLKLKEGMSPTEVICTIQTVSDLKVDSSVKEFDVEKIKVGTKVSISSNITKKVIDSNVIEVKSTPQETQSDDANAKKSVKYKTSIALPAEGQSIYRPGMNVRVKYILSEEKNVFTVPSSAIFERDGKKYVLYLKESGKNYVIEKLEVTKGLENDFECVIKSRKLKDGLKILSTSEGYGEGQVVKLTGDNS